MVKNMKRTKTYLTERYDVILALSTAPAMALVAGFVARLLDPGSF